jgi:hypothetical protein
LLELERFELCEVAIINALQCQLEDVQNNCHLALSRGADDNDTDYHIGSGVSLGTTVATISSVTSADSEDADLKIESLLRQLVASVIHKSTFGSKKSVLTGVDGTGLDSVRYFGVCFGCVCAELRHMKRVVYSVSTSLSPDRGKTVSSGLLAGDSCSSKGSVNLRFDKLELFGPSEESESETLTSRGHLKQCLYRAMSSCYKPQILRKEDTEIFVQVPDTHCGGSHVLSKDRCDHFDSPRNRTTEHSLFPAHDPKIVDDTTALHGSSSASPRSNTDMPEWVVAAAAAAKEMAEPRPLYLQPEFCCPRTLHFASESTSNHSGAIMSTAEHSAGHVEKPDEDRAVENQATMLFSPKPVSKPTLLLRNPQTRAINSASIGATHSWSPMISTGPHSVSPWSRPEKMHRSHGCPISPGTRNGDTSSSIRSPRLPKDRNETDFSVPMAVANRQNGDTGKTAAKKYGQHAALMPDWNRHRLDLSSTAGRCNRTSDIDVGFDESKFSEFSFSNSTMPNSGPAESRHHSPALPSAPLPSVSPHRARTGSFYTEAGLSWATLHRGCNEARNPGSVHPWHEHGPTELATQQSTTNQHSMENLIRSCLTQRSGLSVQVDASIDKVRGQSQDNNASMSSTKPNSRKRSAGSDVSRINCLISNAGALVPSQSAFSPACAVPKVGYGTGVLLSPVFECQTTESAEKYENTMSYPAAIRYEDFVEDDDYAVRSDRLLLVDGFNDDVSEISDPVGVNDNFTSLHGNCDRDSTRHGDVDIGGTDTSNQSNEENSVSTLDSLHCSKCLSFNSLRSAVAAAERCCCVHGSQVDGEYRQKNILNCRTTPTFTAAINGTTSELATEYERSFSSGKENVPSRNDCTCNRKRSTFPINSRDIFAVDQYA